MDDYIPGKEQLEAEVERVQGTPEERVKTVKLVDALEEKGWDVGEQHLSELPVHGRSGTVYISDNELEGSIEVLYTPDADQGYDFKGNLEFEYVPGENETSPSHEEVAEFIDSYDFLNISGSYGWSDL